MNASNSSAIGSNTSIQVEWRKDRVATLVTNLKQYVECIEDELQYDDNEAYSDKEFDKLLQCTANAFAGMFNDLCSTL